MLDGQEAVEIAWGELRWEGARQHAGRTGNRANSLRTASLGGSETACWTDRKPWKQLTESFAGRERDSMLDGEETVQIACGKLRWEGASQHAGRRGNRGNSLRRASPGGSETACWTGGNRGNSLRRASLGGSESACWTDRKPCK